MGALRLEFDRRTVRTPVPLPRRLLSASIPKPNPLMVVSQ